MKILARTTILGAAAAMTLAACDDGRQQEQAGAVLGGVIGGVIADNAGGNKEAIVLGAIAGSMIGASIGRQLDEASRRQASTAEDRALNDADVGQQIVWENPGNSNGPAKGVVVVKRQGQDTAGRTCREYSHEVTIAGETEVLIGTACLGDDGRWTRV